MLKHERDTGSSSSSSPDIFKPSLGSPFPSFTASPSSRLEVRARVQVHVLVEWGRAEAGGGAKFGVWKLDTYTVHELSNQ